MNITSNSSFAAVVVTVGAYSGLPDAPGLTPDALVSTDPPLTTNAVNVNVPPLAVRVKLSLTEDAYPVIDQ
jgi:hypothetical protein